MSCEPSLLPLSATIVSPWMPSSRKARFVFSMQVASVSASLRQGMTTLSSGKAVSCGATAPPAATSRSAMAVSSLARALVSLLAHGFNEGRDRGNTLRCPTTPGPPGPLEGEKKRSRRQDDAERLDGLAVSRVAVEHDGEQDVVQDHDVYDPAWVARSQEGDQRGKCRGQEQDEHRTPREEHSEAKGSGGGRLEEGREGPA